MKRFCLVLSLLLLTAPSLAANLPRTWEPVNAPDVVGTLVKQTADSAVIETGNGKQITLPLAGLGDEDLRYLKNMREAVTPFRAWTFTDGGRTRTFQASFVKTAGFDSPLSKTFVVLILDDGRKRGYPLEEFSADDQAYVRQKRAVGPPAPSSDATPNEEYKIRWTDYDPVRDKALINFHATKHFLFIWGNQIEDSAKNWADPAFRQMNFDYFEKIWDFNQNVQHAPMPYADDAEKLKTTVYITGTGLPNQKEGFAFGGLTIEVHPGAMLAGSSVLPHEFTHTLQMHMGGFEGSMAQLVGWFWECHANWNACQFIPSAALALEVYNDRMHYELSSTRDNYGSWPFLVYFAEHPRFDPAFDFDIWKVNKKENGNSVETPFQTMMRLGVEEGKFTGNGVAGFGDMIGEMAAHNVTWDYVYQWTYQNSIKNYQKGMNDASRDRVILQPVPDRAGWYKPLYAQSPKQYGVNIIDLVPTPGARTVTANFQGIVDETEGSDWRVTLVAIDALGRARYSRMAHGGLVTLTLKPGETRLALAVAGTPDIYKPTGFRPGYNVVPHFPYEVSFAGCTPSRVPEYVRSRPDVAGGPHSNGGGFVAASAHVDPACYVAPGAMVLDRAQVTGQARIEDHAVIADNAQISDEAVVGGYAQVRHNAQVSGHARVRDCVTLENDVKIGENARALEYIRIHGHGTIGGDALVKGFGDLYLGPDSPIGGGTIIGENAEIHDDDWHSPVTGGLLYEFMAHDQFAHDVQDNHYLYAHWDFSRPRKQILKGAFADNDGVLRGHPTFVKDGARSAMSFNGKDQYAVIEGSAADTVGLTLDMRMKWLGGPAMQRVLTFVSPDGALSFTPKDAAGHAAFIIRKGAALQTLRAGKAVPLGQWTRVTVALDGDTGVMYFDGQEVGRTAGMTLHPEDIRATAGFIGSNAARGDFFHGELAAVALYRKGFTDVSAVPQETDTHVP